MVQVNDAALLALLPSDWAERDARLRSFALNVAKRGERRWILWGCAISYAWHQSGLQSAQF